MANFGISHTMSRKKIKRGSGQQRIEGKDFRVSDEVRYIQRRAAQYDSRIVAIGPLLLFSTETGDAWILDPSDQLATPIARDGDALPIHIEDSATNFAVGWQGSYRIDGAAFVFQDKDSGNIRAIIGYPTDRIVEHISNMVG
jgi:hypothetical protein